MQKVSVLLLLLSLACMCGVMHAFTFLGKIQNAIGDVKLSSLPDLVKQRKFGDKKIAIITGTSSALGKQTAKKLAATGRYHVIGAVRDLEKMAHVAELEEFNMEHFTAMEVDLQSFDSVKRFVKNVQEFCAGRPIDRIACNAGIYQPTLDYAKWTPDGFEQQLQTNYLSHFLMISMMMPLMKGADRPRVITVGSVTGNDNTVGGGGVYPIADLKQLEGLRAGAKNPVSMIDGYDFNGAKAYKDSKLCLMMLANELHKRYHRSTGIAFSSIYPGCIADSPLFREKRPWFRKYFPMFMKYITGGYVGEDEAGQRLFQVIIDPRCTKSGVYWSWNGGPRMGRENALSNDGQIIGAGGAGGDWDSIYENDQSDKVRDPLKAEVLFDLTSKVTGAEWPMAMAPVSPCPTLKVISAVTAVLDRKEEMQRKARMQAGANSALEPVVTLADTQAAMDEQISIVSGDPTPRGPPAVPPTQPKTMRQAMNMA